MGVEEDSVNDKNVRKAKNKSSHSYYSIIFSSDRSSCVTIMCFVNSWLSKSNSIIPQKRIHFNHPIDSSPSYFFLSIICYSQLQLNFTSFNASSISSLVSMASRTSLASSKSCFFVASSAINESPAVKIRSRQISGDKEAR